MDADLLQFQAVLRRLLDRHASPAEEPDEKLWTLLTEQVGVAGLAVPERYGGSGFGYRECHLVLTELGRAAASTPFLASSVLATGALLLTGDEAAQAELLPDLAAGTRTAALVQGTGGPLTATDTGSSWLIDGQLRHVLDGARADLLLAVARPRNEPLPAIFQLDPTHPGLRRTRCPTMDQSLHLAEVHCRAVPARRLRCDASVLPRLADLAATAITADQIGGARRCLELTVEYTRQRVQFGRPIGSFQAVKHRLADLLVLVESAHSASWAAAAAWADTADDASVLASLAKSYCSQTYRAVTAETVQLHGGVGFTWEHPAHRYFKRAHATATLFGDPAYLRRRLAQHLNLTPP